MQRTIVLISAVVLVVLGAAPITARDRAAVSTAPKQIGELMACRAITEGQARLACFDRQVAELDRATQSREVVIADREAVQSAKRGLFGFAAPVGRLLGFGGNDGEAELKEIQGKVAQVGRTRGGEVRLTLNDGGVWEQNDTRSFVLSPKPGNAVKITRGALGSFFVSVQGQRAIKMRRVQ